MKLLYTTQITNERAQLIHMAARAMAGILVSLFRNMLRSFVAQANSCYSGTSTSAFELRHCLPLLLPHLIVLGLSIANCACNRLISRVLRRKFNKELEFRNEVGKRWPCSKMVGMEKGQFVYYSGCRYSLKTKFYFVTRVRNSERLLLCWSDVNLCLTRLNWILASANFHAFLSMSQKCIRLYSFLSWQFANGPRRFFFQSFRT